MVTVNDFSLTYDYSGIFNTNEQWIHPSATLRTHELIFVTAGRVKIEESENRYDLGEGDFIILSPDTKHFGYEKSRGHTSFFWLHFFSDTTQKIKLPKSGKAPANTEKKLREIMHHAHFDPRLAELALASFLIEISTVEKFGNKLAHEVDEFIRINSEKRLTASSVAAEFGYSADHLARMYRREFGFSLKNGIDNHLLSHAENLLQSTNYKISDVAELCGFDDENGFIKFFGYHSGTTPTAYRNRFFKIHMNVK